MPSPKDDKPEVPKGTHTRRITIHVVLDEDRPPNGKAWDEADIDTWVKQSFSPNAWRFDIVSYSVEFPDGLYDDPKPLDEEDKLG